MERQVIVETAIQYPIDEIIARYAAEQDVPLDVAQEHAREVKRFLVLCALNPHRNYGMRGPIDEFWHTFVIFSAKYMEFCNRISGRYIHHFPNTREESRIKYTFNRGRRGGPEKEAVSGIDLRQLYLDMLDDYKLVFGEEAPVHLWPRPNDDEIDSIGCFPCGCGCSCLA
jgi:hypothetical protein